MSLEMKMGALHCGRAANFTKGCGGKELMAELKTQPDSVLMCSSCQLWESLLARRKQGIQRERECLVATWEKVCLSKGAK